MIKKIFLFLLIFFIFSIPANADGIINGGFELDSSLPGWDRNTPFIDRNIYHAIGNYNARLYVGSTSYPYANLSQTFYNNTAGFIHYDVLGFSFQTPGFSGNSFVYVYGDSSLLDVFDANAAAPYNFHRTVNIGGYDTITIMVHAVDPLALTKFMYFDNVTLSEGPPPPQITTIQTRITKETFPLTGIVINDADSTGGFPNEQGYVTLTPTNNSEKIYPITLNGNDLIDGFELQITATGSEVTATPITVNNLGVDRTYNIYLDGQFIEKIGEVTSYQYNITSFSTHTLKVEYDYYVPPSGEDGGGSGPVTPPDEDILPPDEDEIIIEDDVITIGNLTITKEEFQLLTIEQLEAMNVSQDTKDKLIAIKSINVNWWMFILGLCLLGVITEGSRKEGNEVILLISITGVIVSAYKLGYF